MVNQVKDYKYIITNILDLNIISIKASTRERVNYILNKELDPTTLKPLQRPQVDK